MQNRLKKLRLEKRLTLADVQAKTNIDFKILKKDWKMEYLTLQQFGKSWLTFQKFQLST